jgi:iron(III) transport system substrate-binding protein
MVSRSQASDLTAGRLAKDHQPEVSPMFRQMRIAPWLRYCAYALVLVGALGCSRQPRVVVYCAQDKEFAEQIFADFQKQAGLLVAPHYDTEKTKSVSLYVELVNEAERPRCDVFWNNEIISTIRLQRKGILQPYASPAAAPYPAWCRGPDDTWHAFAWRTRVLLVNTKLVAESDRPKSLLDLTDPRWKGKAAMAKPQYGMSATQAVCLFEVLGKEKARAYYLGLRDNQIAILGGNKDVAVKVGQGEFAVGMTDTDDALAEVKAGRPVVLIFPDSDRPAGDRMGTLCVPNTVSLIKGAPDVEGGRKLIDFLLSPEVEKSLAESDSHQVPLNPQVKAKLPAAMEPALTAKKMDVDWNKAADLWDEVQSFLSEQFARPQ